jgi:outer membrane protein TolC
MTSRWIPLVMTGALLATGLAPATELNNAPAKPLVPAHLILDDAISEALAANPGLQAVGSSAAAAESEAKAARRQRWGTIDGVASYDHFSDDVIVRTISGQLLEAGIANLPFDNQQWHYGLVAEIPLYVGGQLSKGIEITELNAEKTAALLEGTRWQVRFNVTSLYATAQSLDAVDAAIASRISALEATDSRLELMVAEGKRPDVDRLKVVEELEAARADRAAILGNRRKVGALLLSLLGRDPTSNRVEVDPMPQAVPKLTEPVADLQSGLDDVSIVREARLALEQAESQVGVATSEFLPKLVARGHYLVNAGQSLDRDYNTWAVSLDVRVPLLHGGTRVEHRVAAKEQRAAAEHTLQKVRLDTAAHLEDALAQLDAAREAIKAAEARVAAGTEAARIEQIRYDTGAGTIEDLLRARSREQGARADLARSRAQALTAAARINSIVEKEAVL